MICQKTEPELEQLHREAAACCELLTTLLLQAGCPRDDAHKVICRFAGLYKNLGLDVARMERLIQ